MLPSGGMSAVYAAILLLIAPHVAAQSPTQAAPGAITTLDCYKDVSPLVNTASYQFAADGWCQGKCAEGNHTVMAMVGGSTCYCGDIIPSKDKIVPKSNCNYRCNGFGDKTCGGIGFYQVYLVGLTADVKTAANGSDTADSPSSAASGSAAPVITTVGETVVVTAPASSGGKPAPSKAGIAIGIVVAVIIVATAIGATVFFLKRRKQRAIQQEHERNAAIAQFTKPKTSETSSTTDQRLEPAFLSSHRRESIGSIADEMDFSRRILQVRNPDHRSSSASGFA